MPAGAYVAAAFAGLQDTAPRDALLGLHARVAECEPGAWESPGLIQTYSPRKAVFVLPKKDFGVFTVGRLPRDPVARQAIEDQAEAACQALPTGTGDIDRAVCATGRIAVRWTASSLTIFEVPRPTVDLEAARLELCRRHVHAFGPTTPAAFAWWAGVSARDARTSFDALDRELTAVDFDGTRAWIMAADAAKLVAPKPIRGVRLLVVPDLRLFGQDRAGLFVGPGLRQHCPQQDTFHPNGVMVNGEVIGAWGRRGGRVTVKLGGGVSAATRRSIIDEAERMPIPEATVTVDFV
jgi:hypothetical protein